MSDAPGRHRMKVEWVSESPYGTVIIDAHAEHPEVVPPEQAHVRLIFPAPLPYRAGDHFWIEMLPPKEKTEEPERRE